MIHIDFSASGLFINGTACNFPIPLSQLSSLLGTPRVWHAKNGGGAVWDSLGISCQTNKTEFASAIFLNYRTAEYQQYPTHLFQGSATFEGEEITAYFKDNPQAHIKTYREETGRALVLNSLRAWFDLHEKEITLIQIDDEIPKIPVPPKPLPVDSEFAHLEPLWLKWELLIAQIIGRDSRYFNVMHGITENDLLEHSHLGDKLRIPAELINFYKIRNVDYDAVSSPFRFSVNSWDYDLIPFKDIAKEWQDIQDLNCDGEENQDLIDQYSKRVQASGYANPLWTPFATGRNGDYLLLDMDPSAEGHAGQIIELQNESWSREVVADSLAELLQREVDQIENKQIEKFQFFLNND